MALRVYEGIPVMLGLGKEVETIEFVNTNADDNISVLLEVKEDVG